MKILACIIISAVGRALAFDPTVLVSRFALLDSDGNEAPSKVPNFNVAPFGVLVAVQELKGGRFNATSCTATYLNQGRGVTSAHCLPHPQKKWDYYVIFYDTEGTKVVFPVIDFPFVGNDNFDIAVFRVAEGAFPRWDAAGMDIRDYTTRVIKKGEDPDEGLVIWSYTPIDHFPEFQKKFPNAIGGMVFTANRCVGSLIKPKIEYWSKAPIKGKRKYLGQLIFSDGMTPKDHIFLDRCQYPIVKGNSGALITLAANFNQKVGILRGTVASKEQVWRDISRQKFSKRGISMLYHGVDGRREEMTVNDGTFHIGAGVRFDALTKKSPNALPPK